MTPPWGERRRGAPSPSGSAALSAGHGQCVSRCGETHSAPLRCSPGCRRTWTARTSPSRPRTTARCCWRSSLLWRIGASRSNRIAIRMFGREGPMGGMSAQRRPGLQPGDTAGGDNEKRIATQHAQRRPGLQPGDTSSSTLPRRSSTFSAQRRPGLQPGDTSWRRRSPGSSRTSLNEGRDSNPATPGISSRRMVDVLWRAQRRPGLQPGDTSRRRAWRCTRPSPLNEGRDSNPATPSGQSAFTVRLSTPLNEGRDSNPATPIITSKRG